MSVMKYLVHKKSVVEKLIYGNRTPSTAKQSPDLLRFLFGPDTFGADGTESCFLLQCIGMEKPKNIFLCWIAKNSSSELSAKGRS